MTQTAPDVLTIPRREALASSKVDAPPSKSATNRALILASLANGPSRLRQALRCDDTLVMTRCLARLGVPISSRRGDTLLVEGTGGSLESPDEPLDVGASGTALRFLTTVSALCPGPVVLTGDARLRERPMADLVIALRRMGVEASARGTRGRPPIHVAGGGFPGGTVRLSGGVSSQFVSALLMLGPFGRSDLRLSLRRTPVSAPYIRLTVGMIRSFGGEVSIGKEGLSFHVRAGGGYQGKDETIEGDASSASYFLALAAMLGSRLTIGNLDMKSAQGDLGMIDLLQRMGCRVARGDRQVTVEGGELRGIEADMVDMPDVVPTMAVAALWARGATSIRNVGNLRLKESDRLSALARELSKAGASVRELRDGLVIESGRSREPTPVRISTYGDHRIAMSFAVLGVARGGISIEDPRTVMKSYPGFWDDLGAAAGITWPAGPAGRRSP